MAPHRTNPFDVVLGLRLLGEAGTLAHLAAELAVAPSQVHAALRRLERAGLLRGAARATNPRSFGEFVLFGVRYAFPALRGPLADGVPTAYSAPELARHVDAGDVVVWPSPRATNGVRGFAIRPLYPAAVRLPETSPETYRLLTLVDALRIGDASTRNAARAALETAIGWRTTPAAGTPAV